MSRSRQRGMHRALQCRVAVSSRPPTHQASHPPDQLLRVEHCALDAWLGVSVMVLDAIQQLAQAPAGRHAGEGGDRECAPAPALPP